METLQPRESRMSIVNENRDGFRALVHDLVFALSTGDTNVIETVQDGVRRVLIARRKTA